MHPDQPIALWWRKLHTWQQLSTLEKAWIAPAWVLLGIARIGVLALPFRHLTRLLGNVSDAPTLTANSVEIKRAQSLGRAVRIAARYTPWNANCLAQALAARVLLRLYRIPHVIQLGVIRSPDGELCAHAWMDAGPVRVTGGYGSERFTVVKRFSSPSSNADS